MKYELAFWGKAMVTPFPRYRRRHNTAVSVRGDIAKVYAKLEANGISTDAHRAVVYDAVTGEQISLPKESA